MPRKIHRVAQEVKADAIRRIKGEGLTVSQAAKDYGVHETTVYGWLGAGSQGAPSWSEFAKVQKQNKELLALVGELTLRLSAGQKRG
jgi:transposase-like protein